MARVARWRLENGALTTDSQGSNTLTDNNGVTADTADYKEGAASGEFVRTSNQFLSIADASLDSGFPFKSGSSNNLITVCFWVKFASLALSADRVIFAKYDYANNKRCFVIEGYSTQYLRFSYGYNNGTAGAGSNDIPSIQTNRWYHVAIKIDQANKTRQWRVWDDTAQAIHYTTSALSFANAISITDAAVTIGSYPNSSSSYAHDGNIDDVQIYDTLLSDTEIDNVRLYGTAGDDHTLVITDSAHVITSESLVLTQNHVLAVQDTIHTFSSDSIALLQNQVLVVADSAHALTSDSPTIDFCLMIADSSHTLASDGLTLSQIHNLAIADSFHSLSSDSLPAMGGAIHATPDPLPDNTFEVNFRTQAWGDFPTGTMKTQAWGDVPAKQCKTVSWNNIPTA